MRQLRNAKEYWDGRMGARHVRHTQEIVLDFGREQFTRNEIPARLGLNNTQSIGILNRAIRAWDPKSIRDLARKMTRDGLWARDRVGTTTMEYWLVCMEVHSLDSKKWFRSKSSIPAGYAKTREKGEKKKKR
jgi:hypothetical protein